MADAPDTTTPSAGTRAPGANENNVVCGQFGNGDLDHPMIGDLVRAVR